MLFATLPTEPGSWQNRAQTRPEDADAADARRCPVGPAAVQTARYGVRGGPAARGAAWSRPPGPPTRGKAQLGEKEDMRLESEARERWMRAVLGSHQSPNLHSPSPSPSQSLGGMGSPLLSSRLDLSEMQVLGFRLFSQPQFPFLYNGKPPGGEGRAVGKGRPQQLVLRLVPAAPGKRAGAGQWRPRELACCGAGVGGQWRREDRSGAGARHRPRACVCTQVLEVYKCPCVARERRGVGRAGQRRGH